MGHFSQDAVNPVTGYFRWGPADRSKPPYARELNPPTMLLLQVAGVGGTTLHYSAISPRAMPGVFQGYRRRDRSNYDTRHLFPLSYRELIPYYEWVEETLPVQTAAMGTKGQAFFEGARRAGLPLNRFKDITRPSFHPQENAILQPGGTAGRSDRRRDAHFPRARGCTFCGHCLEGCFEPLGAPRNLKAKRSTDNSYIPMALTADFWRHGGRAATLAHRCLRRTDRVLHDRIDSDGHRSLMDHGDHRRAIQDRARVIVLAAGSIESPACG